MQSRTSPFRPRALEINHVVCSLLLVCTDGRHEGARLGLIWVTVRRRRATNSDLDSTWDGAFFTSASRRSFHTPSMAFRSGLLFGKSVCNCKPASAIAC